MLRGGGGRHSAHPPPLNVGNFPNFPSPGCRLRRQGWEIPTLESPTPTFPTPDLQIGSGVGKVGGWEIPTLESLTPNLPNPGPYQEVRGFCEKQSEIFDPILSSLSVSLMM